MARFSSLQAGDLRFVAVVLAGVKARAGPKNERNY
jgi:hypothetical protein